jgi:hypothetical protein
MERGDVWESQKRISECCRLEALVQTKNIGRYRNKEEDDNKASIFLSSGLSFFFICEDHTCWTWNIHNPPENFRGTKVINTKDNDEYELLLNGI